MESIAQMYWEDTCNFCIKVRNVIAKGFESMIELFESIGCARAASQLASMGRHEEAKALMLYKKELDSKK